MDVFEAVQRRHSTRAYKPDSVPEEKLRRILEAGRLAPSAGNIQPWHFVIVKNREIRETLAKGGRYARFLAESPVVIVGCGDQKASPNWYMVDVAISMQNMVLTATEEGLATCWIGSFKEERVRRLLKIPDNFRVIALMALGYPQKRLDIEGKILHFVRRKKSLKEISSLDECGKSFEIQNHFLAAFSFMTNTNSIEAKTRARASSSFARNGRILGMADDNKSDERSGRHESPDLKTDR